MKQYLTAEEYLNLTNELKELVEKKREPNTAKDIAFALGYDGHVNGIPFLKIYAELLTNYPQSTVYELHALCLGYGTAGSVLDEINNEDANKNETYH